MIAANDFDFLDKCFIESGSALGDVCLRNKQNMDRDDVAVFKHSLNTRGMCFISQASDIAVFTGLDRHRSDSVIEVMPLHDIYMTSYLHVFKVK